TLFYQGFRGVLYQFRIREELDNEKCEKLWKEWLGWERWEEENTKYYGNKGYSFNETNANSVLKNYAPHIIDEIEGLANALSIEYHKALKLFSGYGTVYHRLKEWVVPR